MTDFQATINSKFSIKLILNVSVVEIEDGWSKVLGGYSHGRRTEWAKKLVSEGPKTKLAKSQEAIAIQFK